ncbi:MAG: hypothetical protein AB1330_08020 [Bacillota bacterium]
MAGLQSVLVREGQTQRFRRNWFLVCGCIIIGYLLLRVPACTRIPVSEVLREINVRLVPVRCLGLQKVSGDYSVVYFPRGQEEEARLVLKGAERFLPEVAAVFGLDLKRRVPVVICREQEELNRLFGWPADEGTMGVYWAGTVWVLSPSSWVEAPDGAAREEKFFRSGPLVHEAAHLMVDYQTRGNYPRWLTEGLAQEVERRLVGFSFDPPREIAAWYPFFMLEQFDALPDQRVAYYQSFLMVQYLLRHGGEAGVAELLAALGQGQSFDRALEEVMGYDVSEFEARFFHSLSQ